MYSYQSRIRYSELDETGHLKIESLLDYFQDCSTFHSEDIGLGVEYLKQRHMVWVMSSWQIVVSRYPKLGETVTVGTAPYGFKGFIGLRNFLMEDEEGRRLACANTVWSLIDTENARPVKPTADMMGGYVLEPKLEMEYAPRKIAVPEGAARGESIVVRKHHLDMNHHVNNGQYIRMAMDALSGNGGIRQLRAEYKRQVYLNDVLIPYITAADDGKQIVTFKDKEEAVCCIVEIERE